ncbi:hypothetical protein AcW1_004436 [Taiwanofungus camphoratus]|nr:hypothetical protein AcW2_006558 [Antrodia cinnamomea]KAI0939370.1 hypothetical protein AcV5_000810 [Antrodia cinnamomea]KAI0959676.1 hypothetical protein AcW1_004436 [Antrodia cinnamomea]
MSTSNAPARQAAPANARLGANQEESTLRKFWSMAQQFLIIWVVMQFAGNFFQSKTPPAAPAVPSLVPDDALQSDASGTPSPQQLLPAQAQPAWPLGIPVSIHVYLSTSPTGDVFSRQWTSGWRQDQDAGLPNFVWENITFGNWKETRTVDYIVSLPPSVQNNGSLWADVFLVPGGVSPDPTSQSFDPRRIHHIRKLLTRYLAKAKVRKEKNLLNGQEDDTNQDEELQTDIIVSHWHTNLTLALVSDAPVIPYSQLPPPVSKYVELLPERDQAGRLGFYKPIIFPNDFWHLRSQYTEINTTTTNLPLQITFQPMSYWKFQLFSSLIQGFDDAAKQQGGSGAELDEIKRMFVETNPWFLGLTGLVSVLHMVFEMLAFSSDVTHWRKKEELVGVSLRSIATNIVVQIIILLYLIDNNEQTSWMILMGSGVGVLIEAWKITKAVDISVVPAVASSWFPYKIDIKDKHVLSEEEKKTQEYDKLAFRYVTWFTIPCLAAYTIYSLIYETHRGWYSFVISTLTSFVYMFGFAQLIPQLIINYKLKSVAHMPMKAMIYKTLSTVVDDLFAFCIKMPILHRLACFRDDVVFLVFLYQVRVPSHCPVTSMQRHHTNFISQRWIYRIDPKRVNEYGQVMASEVEAVEAKKRNEVTETKKNK